MVMRFAPAALGVGLATVGAAAVEAQPLGTFTWQLQPFCNVVTVNLTQQGAVCTMDGFDDQCGAAQHAPFVGLATTAQPTSPRSTPMARTTGGACRATASATGSR